MRLRYLAAAPLVAVAMVGTTAAAWPSSTAAVPQAPPALTARALSDRYTAEAKAIKTAERAAIRHRDSQLASALAGLAPRQVLFFNPNGQGVAAMVIGNLATATRVAILAPGSDTTLATFFSRGPASPGGGAEALAAQARRLEPSGPGERLAVIAWLGYPAPAMLSPGVMTSGDAGQGAQALRPLVTALARHGDRVALLCQATDRWSAGWLRRTWRSPTSRCSAARGWTPPRWPRSTPGPGCGPAGRAATRSGSCRTSSCSGSASAPTRCRPGPARASSPPVTAATAATWTRARSRCAT